MFVLLACGKHAYRNAFLAEVMRRPCPNSRIPGHFLKERGSRLNMWHEPSSFSYFKNKL